MLYCNWLSAKEGLNPAYDRTGRKWKWRDFRKVEHEGDAWWCDFTANGYRLPTEAEWEYACRAGTTTRYCFGDDEGDLMVQYGWILKNAKSQAWPGALKLPNAWGLFDMHGNLSELCYDLFYGQDNLPHDPIGTVSNRGFWRVLRGGAFRDEASTAVSAYRHFILEPDSRHFIYGFRPARTCP